MSYERSTDGETMLEIYPGWFVSVSAVKRLGLVQRQNAKEEVEYEDRGPVVGTPWGRSVAPWRAIHPDSGNHTPVSNLGRNDVLLPGGMASSDPVVFRERTLTLIKAS